VQVHANLAAAKRNAFRFQPDALIEPVFAG